MQRRIDHIYRVLLGREALKTRLTRRYDRSLKRFLASGQMLRFPKPDKPRLSVVIPLYNSAHHTLRCLTSLLLQVTPEIEIIVHDDASTDQTQELLGRTSGLRIITAKRNQGFIGAINHAAAVAAGSVVLLLNNDAVLREGNLLETAALFDQVPNLGAIGARLALATGELQEAGCFILRDGTTHGYLRGGRLDDPRAMFRRQVDYCSGAFLMIATSIFREMRGLDTAYAPAYYEETDLCMRLRARGLQTIYSPEILIEHFEFGSQGAESSRMAITERRKVFLGRWQSSLAAEGYMTSESQAELAARRLLPRPRLLLITTSNDAEHLWRLASTRNLSPPRFATFCIATVSDSIPHDKRIAPDPHVEHCFLNDLAALKEHLGDRHGYYDAAIVSPRLLDKRAQGILEEASLAPLPISTMTL